MLYVLLSHLVQRLRFVVLAGRQVHAAQVQAAQAAVELCVIVIAQVLQVADGSPGGRAEHALLHLLLFGRGSRLDRYVERVHYPVHFQDRVIGIDGRSGVC